MELDQQTQPQVKAACLTKPKLFILQIKTNPLYYMDSQKQGWEMDLNAMQLIILSDKIQLQNLYQHTDANGRKYTACFLQIAG